MRCAAAPKNTRASEQLSGKAQTRSRPLFCCGTTKSRLSYRSRPFVCEHLQRSRCAAQPRPRTPERASSSAARRKRAADRSFVVEQQKAGCRIGRGLLSVSICNAADALRSRAQEHQSERAAQRQGANAQQTALLLWNNKKPVVVSVAAFCL